MIYQYNYKPTPVFITAKNEKIPRSLMVNFNEMRKAAGPYEYIPDFLTIGLEIEFERLPKFGKAEDAVYELANEINAMNCYVKHDGSLLNGYELVSHPRTATSWMESMKDFNDLFHHMRKMGLRSYTGGRCGLHVHLGLQCFDSDLHVLRFTNFIHCNPSFMMKVSGRTDTSWVQRYCKFENPREMSFYFAFGGIDINVKNAILRKKRPQIMKGQMVGVNGRAQLGQHHSAVSFTPSTLELRVFRGTLNTSKIYAIIEFAIMLLSFTQFNMSLYPKAKDFIEYINRFPRKLNLKKSLLDKITYEGKEKWAPTTPGEIIGLERDRVTSHIARRNATLGLRRQ